jgi:cyclin H
MGDLLKSFKFHLHVEATAMIYFKRFLLYHSIMQFDVNILMLTCIFLASKIEENRLKLDDYLRQVEALTKSSIEKNEIRKTELILLQGLQFDLIVYHPYRSLHGIIHDFFEPDRQGEATELYENAKKFIRESYKTDVSFLYAPGTIALAALFHFKPTDTEHFIEKNYASKDIDIEHLMQSIKKIDSIVSALSTDKQQIDSEKAALKSAKMKLKKMKKLIEKYKVFDTVELERQQEEEEMRRRDQKLRQRGEMEKKEIEKLFS